MKTIQKITQIKSKIANVLIVSTVLFILVSCILLTIDIIKNGANL